MATHLSEAKELAAQQPGDGSEKIAFRRRFRRGSDYGVWGSVNVSPSFRATRQATRGQL